MNTSTKPTTSIAWEEEADFTSIRYQARPETQGSLMPSKRRLLKWFGILLTVLWGAAAFAPGTFNIPLSFQPWLFLTFALWFFVLGAGLINL